MQYNIALAYAVICLLKNINSKIVVRKKQGFAVRPRGGGSEPYFCTPSLMFVSSGSLLLIEFF